MKTKITVLFAAFFLITALASCQKTQSTPSETIETSSIIWSLENDRIPHEIPLPTSEEIKNIESFSFAEESAKYKKGADGVNTSGFKNINISDANTQAKAIELAKNEVTVSYNTISVAYDRKQYIWRVTFYKANTAGGGQTVYLGVEGKTKLVVSGE